MKKKITLFTCALIISHVIVIAQANVSLSNLSNATAINASLKPRTDNSFDLGKPDSAWRNLHLKGTVFINGKRIVNNVDAGNGNLLFGTGAGTNITTGTENIALGNSALNQNTTGTGNIAIGLGTLFLSNASSNTAVGDQSMVNTTIGANNSSFGFKSLFANTVGVFNCAFGYRSLTSNSGSGGFASIMNSAFGANSLAANTSGSFNAAFGYAAVSNNTTGINNTGMGYTGLLKNTTGQDNTAIGAGSMLSNTTGSWNTAIGKNALYVNTAQDKNTAVGWDAGNVAQSAASTYLGFSAHASVVVNNSMALGTNAVVTASNQVRIGNNTVTSIGGYANWTNISDGRYKKNISSNVPGLEFIKSLNPVTYSLDIAGLESKLNPSAAKNSSSNNEERSAIAAKSKVIYTGFIAQEVEEAAKKIGYDFSGVDAPKDKNDLYGLRYSEFVVPLVKAVQELSAENEQLRSRLDKIEALLAANANLLNPKNISLPGTAAKLDQNYPNPYNNSTAIPYFVPGNVNNASLNFYNSTGSLIKSVKLSAGKGTVTLNSNELASGIYSYSLITDGKVFDTKQMARIK